MLMDLTANDKTCRSARIVWLPNKMYIHSHLFKLQALFDDITGMKICHPDSELLAGYACRTTLMQHYSRNRHSQHMQVFEEGTESSGWLTAADAIKLSSWLVSASKVFDHLMLIARLIISDSCTERDNHMTSLVTLFGSKKHLWRSSFAVEFARDLFTFLSIAFEVWHCLSIWYRVGQHRHVHLFPAYRMPCPA